MKKLNITYTTYASSSDENRAMDKAYKEYMNKYGKRFARGERYRKYMVLDVNDIHTVTKTKVVSEQPGQPIISHMVRLGGPFEEVGGTDEIIGREDQRLGSDNK